LITPQLLREAAASHRRILVVEDNRVNQLVITRMLERAGHLADAAAEGLEAVIAVEKCDYDLVLMEARTPSIGGAEATARIRKLGSGHANVPIVAVAAAITPEDRAAFLAAGFDDTLAKPFSDADVKEILSRWAGRRSTHGADSAAVSASDEPGVAPDLAAPETKEAWTSPPARILVADDSRVNVMFVARLLERAGHTVDVALNGAEAVAATSHNNYDLIFMDIRMPEMDGIEAAHRIRQKSDAGGSIPIVALTANDVETDRNSYMAAGFDDCAEKPISEAVLRDLVNRWSGQKHGAAGSEPASPLRQAGGF
jgi:CheY-like chemotaxis protein